MVAKYAGMQYREDRRDSNSWTISLDWRWSRLNVPIRALEFNNDMERDLVTDLATTVHRAAMLFKMGFGSTKHGTVKKGPLTRHGWVQCTLLSFLGMKR